MKELKAMNSEAPGKRDRAVAFILLCSMGSVVLDMIKKAAGVFFSFVLAYALCVPVYSAAPPDFYAAGAILMEQSGRRVLFERDADKRLPMASTTKIMSSLLAVESDDFKTGEYFTYPDKTVMVEGSAMGLKFGDKVNMQALLAGMLLSSGNDAANVVAYRLGGGTSGFALMMNARAKEIGMKNTNFVTPSGLDAEEHYSTARDMALLGCEALDNPDFLAVCSKRSVQVSFGSPPEKRWLYNHNRLLSSYDGANGVKTGFTKKSGRCLVSSATRNGVTLVCVTLNAGDDWNVHRKLFDYGFSLMQSVELDADVTKLTVPIAGSGGVVSGVYLPEKPTAVLKNGEESLVTYDVEILHFVYAPVPRSQVVGRVVWRLGDRVLGEAEICLVKGAEMLKSEK